MPLVGVEILDEIHSAETQHLLTEMSGAHPTHPHVGTLTKSLTNATFDKIKLLLRMTNTIIDRIMF